jgi:hypothetical protein
LIVVFQLPSSKEEWLDVTRDFEVRWNFPHCLGALDGKHVVLQCPYNSGSSYFNYKHDFSIVLFALVDANYLFRYVNIGKPGRMSDGGVFLQTALYKALENGKLNVPDPQPLPGSNTPTPYVFVADDAFPLSTHIMKPFPGELQTGSPRRVYNYRLSRARRLVENSFGILAAVWRIFRKPMMVKIDTAECIVLTCVCLHNFLLRSLASSHLYYPPGYVDYENTTQRRVIPGRWRAEAGTNSGLADLQRIPRNARSDARASRDGNS